MPKILKESDREKLISERKRDKAKAQKEEEKLDKRRAKEDAKMRKLIDKEKEQEKKMKRKSKSAGKGGGADAVSVISDFVQSEKNFIPLFLEKCVEFIEQEGLDSEGIYRVPGNRAHVDLLYQKLQEGEWCSWFLINTPKRWLWRLFVDSLIFSSGWLDDDEI